MSATVAYCGDRRPQRQNRLVPLFEGEASVPGKPRIVIIEDEFFVAWNLQTMLQDLGFGLCEIANDAESGVDCAIHQRAELVLADVNLGGGPDGIEAVRRIRDYRPAAVIFITAYTDEANLTRIRQVAPEAPILSKPVSSELLLANIQKMFP